MNPPQDEFDIAEISRDGFDDEDVRVLQDEAIKRGISFDAACKQLLIEQSKKVSKGPLNLIARLFRLSTVH